MPKIETDTRPPAPPSTCVVRKGASSQAPSDSKEPKLMPIPSSKAKTQAKPQTKSASAQPKPASAIAPKPLPAIAPKPLPAVIVFGVDQAKKPTAASFTADQVELARKAADLMKLHVIPVEGPELTELAAKLQVGRMYASGHGFVPPVPIDMYDLIADLTY